MGIYFSFIRSSFISPVLFVFLTPFSTRWPKLEPTPIFLFPRLAQAEQSSQFAWFVKIKPPFALISIHLLLSREFWKITARLKTNRSTKAMIFGRVYGFMPAIWQSSALIDFYFWYSTPVNFSDNSHNRRAACSSWDILFDFTFTG